MNIEELSAEEIKAREIAARQAKAAEIREAAARKTGDATEETVEVRVTQFGEGLISTGEHLPGFGDLTYVADDRPTLPVSTAKALQARGLVEIPRVKAPKAEA